MKVLSSKIAQILILLVIFGLSLILVGGVWKGKAQKNQREVPEAAAPDAEMKLTNMEFTEMQHGQKFWTLSASEARYFQDQQRTLLTGVHLTFYLDKDGEEIHVTSREGILYAGTKNIELSGEVHSSLPREYVVDMEKAVYEHQKRTIWSDTPVRISGPGLELEARNWEYRIPIHTAFLGGGIKASLVGAKLAIDR